jgi:hypothetical protein
MEKHSAEDSQVDRRAREGGDPEETALRLWLSVAHRSRPCWAIVLPWAEGRNYRAKTRGRTEITGREEDEKAREGSRLRLESVRMNVVYHPDDFVIVTARLPLT